MCTWWAPQPSKLMCRVKLTDGFDPHALPPIRIETPFKSGVFNYFADINSDNIVNILDIIQLVNIILN